MRLEMTPHKEYCRAEATVEYIQRDRLASVSGRIKSDDCDSAGGDYTVAVRVRDANGDLHNFEYVEAWQTDANTAFGFNKDYDIGPDVDLIRVRVRKVICVCTDAVTGNELPPNKGENDE